MAILFAVYKKRWTAPGYKLVGTVEFTLQDLKEDIRKATKIGGTSICGSIIKDYAIKANRKNVTLSGTLTLGVEIKQQYFLKECVDEKKNLNSVENCSDSFGSGIGDTATVQSRIPSRRMSDLFNPTNLLELTRHRRKSSFSKLQALGGNSTGVGAIDVTTMTEVDSEKEKEKSDLDELESGRNSEDSSFVRPRSFSYQEVCHIDARFSNCKLR